MRQIPLRVDAKLIRKLQRVQQNCLGHVTLDDINVDVVYPDGTKIVIELQIEPKIILRGRKWWTGVAYNPEYYDGQFADAPDYAQDIGEWIAYGINEGAVTEDTQNDDDDKPIHWKVQKRSVAKLRKWGVILP